MADQFEIEIAIEEPGHASQLIDLGVHRIEVCSNLNEGGLTPSAAQIEMTVDVSDLPVYVMLRPPSKAPKTIPVAPQSLKILSSSSIICFSNLL